MLILVTYKPQSLRVSERASDNSISKSIKLLIGIAANSVTNKTNRNHLSAKYKEF